MVLERELARPDPKNVHWLERNGTIGKIGTAKRMITLSRAGNIGSPVRSSSFCKFIFIYYANMSASILCKTIY